MLILCGHSISFSVNNLGSAGQVFLNLLAVYYCFDQVEPACYGILPLLQQFCLNSTPSNTKVSYQDLLKEYEAFLVRNAE